MEQISHIFSNLAPIGIVAAAVAYIIVQVRTGGTKASSEVIATYREQVGQLKAELMAQAKNHSDQMTAMSDRHSTEMSKLTAKVGELTGLVQAKDSQIKELKDLLLEKSPEMIDFYKKGNSYFSKAEPIISQIAAHLQIVPKV